MNILWLCLYFTVGLAAPLEVKSSTAIAQKYITAAQTELMGLTVVTTFDQDLYVRAPTCAQTGVNKDCLLSNVRIDVNFDVCTTSGCAKEADIMSNAQQVCLLWPKPHCQGQFMGRNTITQHLPRVCGSKGQISSQKRKTSVSLGFLWFFFQVGKGYGGRFSCLLHNLLWGPFYLYISKLTFAGAPHPCWHRVGWQGGVHFYFLFKYSGDGDRSPQLFPVCRTALLYFLTTSLPINDYYELVPVSMDCLSTQVCNSGCPRNILATSDPFFSYEREEMYVCLLKHWLTRTSLAKIGSGVIQENTTLAASSSQIATLYWISKTETGNMVCTSMTWIFTLPLVSGC